MMRLGEYFVRLGVALVELESFIYALMAAPGIMRWKELACRIKEPQDSIGTCSSTRSLYAIAPYLLARKIHDIH